MLYPTEDIYTSVLNRSTSNFWKETSSPILHLVAMTLEHSFLREKGVKQKETPLFTSSLISTGLAHHYFFGPLPHQPLIEASHDRSRCVETSSSLSKKITKTPSWTGNWRNWSCIYWTFWEWQVGFLHGFFLGGNCGYLSKKEHGGNEWGFLSIGFLSIWVFSPCISHFSFPLSPWPWGHGEFMPIYTNIWL